MEFGKGIYIASVVFIAIAFLGTIAYGVTYAFTDGEEDITIKDKWVKYHGDDAKYLVSSYDGQVFEITDSFWKFRYDSSNLYAKLEANMTCHIKTQGFRFPFFSDYKNIIEADCE